MIRYGPAWLLLLCLGIATPARPAETLDLGSLLGRPIIEPERPLREVQDFTEARVPPMLTPESVEEWEAHANAMRHETLRNVVFRGEAAGWREGETKVEWLGVIPGGPGYHIKKLRYEALPGLWIPALLYEPLELHGKVPAVMNVNGHEGAGKAAQYKQMRCINQAKRGMLALNLEWLGMGQLRGDSYTHYRMNQIDLCGTSGLAPFYLCMERGLDILLAHPHADPERVAVAGLSGGGWQTITISALDLRVKLANPVAGYSSFRTRARHLSDLGDSEQTPVDLATVTDYAHLTAMLAPRPALLTYNAKDNCCFRADHALPPLLEAARPIYKLYGKEENLHSHVNEDPGTHNFERENREVLYRTLGRYFFGGIPAYKNEEIPSEGEVKSQDDLAVELPDKNANFNTLALALSRNLPRNSTLPQEKAAAGKWRTHRNRALRQIVRARHYDVKAKQVGEERFAGGKATFWTLRIGEDWTLPAVELAPAASGETSLFIADGGYSTGARQIAGLIEAGQSVLAVDPFYLGASKITGRDFLFALLVSAVGERPLGIQASQLGAVARWLHGERKTPPVRIVALGRRTSLMAVVAAALEENAIGAVELHSSFGSLKEIIEENLAASQVPELFCFGLLEQFDIRQLAALVAPRPVRFVEPGDRVRKELAGMDRWYALHGVEFDPLATDLRASPVSASTSPEVKAMPEGYSIPIIDLAGQTDRQVIVDREKGQYLGHPTTVLLEDSRTMIAVYPKGHGRGAIVMKRSTDAGLTWSERLPTPASWATSKEVPTIHRVIDPEGKKRLILFSGLYPIRMAVSEDDGVTWSELEPIGDFGGIVAMASVARLRNGDYMAFFHDDGRFIRAVSKRKDPPEFKVYSIVSRDGGLTWSEPAVIAQHATAHICEPGFIRSPDGRQIALLMRENSRKQNGFAIFSDDEGKTWTRPRELPGALTGDRHTGRYAPDGRLFVTFRDTTLVSPTKGDWVGWIGTYDDIVKGSEGQYRVRLMKNHRGADCAYPGLDLLPDGTFVATTYGHWTKGEQPYIASVRFKLEELDEHAEAWRLRTP